MSRLVLCLIFLLPLAAHAAGPEFGRDVLPVLKSHCGKCNGESVQQSELNLLSLKAIRKGGESGETIVPGKPEERLVVEMIRDGHIPPAVQRDWRLYYQYSSFVHGLVRPKRGFFEKMAEWRMRTGNFTFPAELKVFNVLDRVFGWRAHKEHEKQSWIMSSENEQVTMVGGSRAKLWINCCWPNA